MYGTSSDIEKGEKKEDVWFVQTFVILQKCLPE